MMEIEVNRAAKDLASIVGEQYVMSDPATLDIYSRDMTVEPPALPDFVVMPQTVEEVQEVVRFANKKRMPMVPFVTGTNLGGLTIPRRGGMVVDLKRMNKIIEVDEGSMYAVVEPGVSFGDMEYYLNHHCGNLAMKAGCHGDMINGLEAVLPTGEVMTTGSIGASPYWFGRHPLPDFCGLFINWKGTSGIVTKIAVQLWPRQPFEEFYAVGIWNIEDLQHILGRIIRAEITDEQSGRSREAIEVGLGMYKPGERTLPWDMLVMHAISASTKNLFDAKVEALREILKDETQKGRRAEILEQFSANDLARQVSQFPSSGTAVSWMDYGKRGEKIPGGGASWVGGYLPLNKYTEGFKKARAIMEKYDFPPMITQRTMGLGRYTIMRFLVPYKRKDAEEVKEVREMLRELAQNELEHGALMYKAPEWATKMMWEKADARYLEFLKRVKKFLDPNDIMNPGKLGF